MKHSTDYPCIRAWDRMMGSSPYYTGTQVERAREQKQPQDVTFERGGYDTEGKRIEGKWARLSEVTSGSTRWYFINHHRDLVEQYAPDWLKDDEIKAELTRRGE